MLQKRILFAQIFLKPERTLRRGRQTLTGDGYGDPMLTPSTVTPDAIRRAPKVLLHDHLDGGLRPQTVLDLADATGYPDLPVADAAAAGKWFRDAADSGSLERYLETFRHTCGVLQTESSLVRVAAECVEDLAADGVIYAEIRYAPELFCERGL